MSKYSFSDSIRDGATLPLNFETVPVDLHVNQDAIDEALVHPFFGDMVRNVL